MNPTSQLPSAKRTIAESATDGSHQQVLKRVKYDHERDNVHMQDDIASAEAACSSVPLAQTQTESLSHAHDDPSTSSVARRNVEDSESEVQKPAAAINEAKDTGKDNSKWKGRPKGEQGRREQKAERRASRNKKRNGGDGNATVTVDSVDKAPRLPKRMCVLLIGYCGTGSNGMQIQPNVRTIEGELFKALVHVGAVSADNADDPTKVGLQRAARTDAGVHAAGNVVSLKMITVIPDILTRINEALPPEIRLWSYIRVQNSFHARLSCDSRKYTYFFPSYILIPPKPGSGLAKSVKEHSVSASASHPAPDDGGVTDDALPNKKDVKTEGGEDVHPFWQTATESTREEDMRRKKEWRAPEDVIATLRAAAKRYEGSHNFHNFTVGRESKDRSCFRYMKKIEVSDPAVYGDTEWISVMLHGQSFMLHQRKMMCVLVMSVRTGTPLKIIDELYSSRTVTIPKMPSLGLLLEHPIFESYNRKSATANTERKLDPTDNDYRPPIDFDIHEEAIRDFKEAQIYSKMRANEERIEVYDRWVNTIDRYAGPDLLYYNNQGIIPDAAVVKKGERRADRFKEKKHFDATDFAEDTSASVFLDEEEVEDEKAVEGISKAELEEAEG